jgi:hypothetical protein
MVYQDLAIIYLGEIIMSVKSDAPKKVMIGFIITMVFVFLNACESTTKANKQPDLDPKSSEAAESWELAGQFEFPENEAASNLKIVATVDQLSHSAQSFASQVVPLILTGESPIADFKLTIDPGLASGESNPNLISIIVFQDDNDNDVNDFDEEFRFVAANDGCSVWCGDLLQCTPSASFMFVPNQTSGTGANGEFTISTAGWYYQQGCRDYSCALLITADASLSGAVLRYSYYNDAPILEQ